MNTPFPSFSAPDSIPAEEFQPLYVVAEPKVDGTDGETLAQYRIVIKRNDALYKTLSIINTMLSVVGVLLIAATFCAVFYGIIVLSEVNETVNLLQNSNPTP
jgi:hypothetical protein